MSVNIEQLKEEKEDKEKGKINVRFIKSFMCQVVFQHSKSIIFSVYDKIFTQNRNLTDNKCKSSGPKSNVSENK